MRTKEFLEKLEHDRISQAIAEVEKKTSGEIRVFVQRGELDDPIGAARQQFEKLGMTATRERNAVLIFVAPRSQKFAVIGDDGIHARCGDDFWHEAGRERCGNISKPRISPTHSCRRSTRPAMPSRNIFRVSMTTATNCRIRLRKANSLAVLFVRRNQFRSNLRSQCKSPVLTESQPYQDEEQSVMQPARSNSSEQQKQNQRSEHE